MRHTLYTKFAVAMVTSVLLFAIGFVSLMVWSNTKYHQEVTQQLHKDLAQYVLDHLYMPILTIGGEVDRTVLMSLAQHTMAINPSVEVYLLNHQGDVLGHALPDESIETMAIDMAPLNDWLKGTNEGPVFAQNPRDNNLRSLFSVAPLMDRENSPYLYVVLDSYEQSTLAGALAGSHILRLSIAAALGLVLLIGLSLWWSTRQLSRPLRKLSQDIRAYRESEFDDHRSVNIKNEVDELAESFNLMQERIQSQFDQLSETDRLRRELISNVSHDLRTPLSVTQGYLETLLIKYEELSDEARKSCAKTAHKHCIKLTHLIRQLFELSKLDAGRVEPNFEEFSMRELLYDICGDYEVLAKDKGISMAVDSPNDPIMVRADIALMERVIQNLLDNALRYTPDGGKITLQATPSADTVDISVKDTGKGIPPDKLPLVFQRHYQAEGQGHKSIDAESGAGLGLNIVKKIMELHDTSIEVESEPNFGTSFNFILPKAFA